MTRSISIAALAALALAAGGCDSCAKRPPPPPQAAPAAGKVDPVEAAKAEYASRWHQEGKKIQGQIIPLIVQEKDDAARQALAERMQAEYVKLEARLRAELSPRYGAAAVAAAIDLFKKEKGVAPPPVPGACQK